MVESARDRRIIAVDVDVVRIPAEASASTPSIG
jgi:hypothetical protein